MWYEGRSEAFLFMRSLEAECLRLEAKIRALHAPPGTIAVGAGQFDVVLSHTAILSFLSGLRRGMTPTEAGEKAKADTAYAVDKHNNQRPNDFAWQRWIGAGACEVDALVYRANQIPVDTT
jgi:hypothetical protein